MDNDLKALLTKRERDWLKLADCEYPDAADTIITALLTRLAEARAEAKHYENVAQDVEDALDAERALSTRLAEAVRKLHHSVEILGNCACGYDGKLVSDLCPRHGKGYDEADEALRDFGAARKGETK